MHKKSLLISLATLALCLLLLVGAFLIVPKPSLAKAPYTPITVSQVGQCAQLASLYDTQTCIIDVSLSHDLTQPIHFTVSTSVTVCYAGKCTKATPASNYVQSVEPSGNTLQYASQTMPILIVAPLDIEGAYETFTFVVSGPSNSVTRTLTTTSEG